MRQAILRHPDAACIVIWANDTFPYTNGTSPLFDSPTLFAAMLDDENEGRFSIAPVEDDVRRRQFYLPDTNVLLTRFLSEAGAGEITDFMPVGQVRGVHRVVRRVTCVRGPFSFRIRCRPCFDYGRADHVTDAKARPTYAPAGTSSA